MINSHQKSTKYSISTLKGMYANKVLYVNMVFCFSDIQAFSEECVPKKYIFLISQLKHMLWVLKRTVSLGTQKNRLMRRFF